MAKECVWNGITYDSIRKAAKDNNITYQSMRRYVSLGYTCDKDVGTGAGYVVECLRCKSEFNFRNARSVYPHKNGKSYLCETCGAYYRFDKYGSVVERDNYKIVKASKCPCCGQLTEVNDDKR